MSDEVTQEEIQRVREWECRMNGHSFTILQVEQSYDPQSVVCTNCGESWPCDERGAQLRQALVEVRQATTYDNCCGQLRKIAGIVNKALR